MRANIIVTYVTLNLISIQTWIKWRICFFVFDGTEDWTQGLMLGNHMLYYRGSFPDGYSLRDIYMRFNNHKYSSLKQSLLYQKKNSWPKKWKAMQISNNRTLFKIWLFKYLSSVIMKKKWCKSILTDIYTEHMIWC